MRSEQGLNINGETLPRATIDMAMRGYRNGKIRFYGFRDNKSDEFTVADDVARIQIEEVRDFIEGYVAGRTNREVERFARAITQKIDESVNR
jgi:hypothetical protein